MEKFVIAHKAITPPKNKGFTLLIKINPNKEAQNNDLRSLNLPNNCP